MSDMNGEKSEMDIYVEEMEMKINEIQQQIDVLMEQKRKLRAEIPESYYSKKRYEKNKDKILQNKRAKYEREKSENIEYTCEPCHFTTKTRANLKKHEGTARHMKIYQAFMEMEQPTI